MRNLDKLKILMGKGGYFDERSLIPAIRNNLSALLEIIRVQEEALKALMSDNSDQCTDEEQSNYKISKEALDKAAEIEKGMRI